MIATVGSEAKAVLANLKLTATGEISLNEVYPPQLPDLFEGRWLWSVGRRNLAEFPQIYIPEIINDMARTRLRLTSERLNERGRSGSGAAGLFAGLVVGTRTRRPLATACVAPPSPRSCSAQSSRLPCVTWRSSLSCTLQPTRWCVRRSRP